MRKEPPSTFMCLAGYHLLIQMQGHSNCVSPLKSLWHYVCYMPYGGDQSLAQRMLCLSLRSFVLLLPRTLH